VGFLFSVVVARQQGAAAPESRLDR